MSKDINDADFVNLANDCVGIGLLPTGKENWELAQQYAKQQNAFLMEALKECESYFDNIADADHDGTRPIANKEMRILFNIRNAIKKSEQP